MLENIKSPDDVKRLSAAELVVLRDEIRKVIIDTVSKNGGHLASNLGLVEATLALHRCFDCPRDKIIFDVSHQSYAHKLITGRYERFGTLRKIGGISGFSSPTESECDTVYAGHSGSSISTALGIAAANKRRGSDDFAVAVVGDGSFTNGMIYEAINNCAEHRDLNLIIVLNDNEMSISQNVGGISRYLSRVRTSGGYLSLKHTLDDFLVGIPLVGRHIARALKWIKDSFKHIFIRDTLFENLGIPYVGPVNGHDIGRLETVFAEAKRRGGVWLIHIVTKKGLGYAPAEQYPEKYHSVGPFDPEVGVVCGAERTFTSEFGRIMCELAESDESVCAVTGAMRDGTGLTRFSELYPDRYTDVGIAEEHAVAFCGGLALSGMKPTAAIYSTFSQRVYDQVLHDVSLQRSHVTLALDHCGIVSGDGVTHQGIFDAALFSSIPNVKIWSPETYAELESSMKSALAADNVCIVRYPKGSERVYDRSGFADLGEMTYLAPRGGSPDCVIVTYGVIAEEAVKASELLSEYRVGVLKLLKIYPLDKDAILPLLDGVGLVYVLEEGVMSGGIGEKLAAMAAEHSCGARVVIRAVDNEYIPHGDRESLLRLFRLDSEQAADEIRSLLRGA